MKTKTVTVVEDSRDVFDMCETNRCQGDETPQWPRNCTIIIEHQSLGCWPLDIECDGAAAVELGPELTKIGAAEEFIVDAFRRLGIPVRFVRTDEN